MKKLTILLLALLLPMISLAQSAEECFKEGENFFNKKDYANAFVWFQKAANQNHAAAQVFLGVMYNKGWGVTIDFTKAFEWYQKAANQGNAEAQYNLGLKYYWGKGVSEDKNKAFEWIQKSANQGYVLAQDEMGYFYQYGKGVPVDYSKAIEWYQKAADQGFELAKKKLDQLQKKMAEGKNALAQLAVSQTESAEECNKKGEEYHDKKYYMQAIEWYQKAADKGSADAQNNLGNMYFFGEGFTKDYSKAAEWYQKAANQGNAKAQCNLGSMYLYGEGVTKDYAKALELYQKAINQGDPLSQVYMGYMYENGWGVTKDYAKALELYQKAVNDGADLGMDYQESLQKKMAKEKNALAQTTSTPTQKPAEKPKEQPKQQVQSQPKEQPKQEQKAVAKAEPKQEQKAVQQTAATPTTPKVMISNVDKSIPVSGQVDKNTFVVVIGNEKYEDADPVPFAENDARIFSEYCKKTLGISEKHIRAVYNAGYNDIRKALSWLKQGLSAYEGEGRVIFYYSGHGIPNESDLSAYLLPVDGDGKDIESAYPLSSLYKSLSELPAKSVLVFLDACFSGAKRNGGMLVSARGVAIKAKPQEAKGKMVIFSAAQSDETAYPFTSQQHGMFTYYLLKKLYDTKGQVTLGELGDYLRKEVKRESFDENNKIQTPTVNASAALTNSWRTIRLK